MSALFSEEELLAMSPEQRLSVVSEIRQQIVKNVKVPPEAIRQALFIANLNLQARGEKRKNSKGVPSSSDAVDPLASF